MPADFTRENDRVQKMDSLINMAVADGVDKALENHGEVLNGREAAALRTLSRDELQTFADINAKLGAVSGRPSDLSAWICGALC